MPKNVIIVGAPRSGTSMTALIFVRKGYYVTDDEKSDLLPADEYNPNGFWEAAGLRDSNEEIFHRAGYPYATTWLSEAINETQASRVLTLELADDHKKLVEHYNSRCPWMWKDPTLCYTIGYWWRLMDPDTTGILFLKRDAKEIYKSFLRRGWCKHGRKARKETINRIMHHMEYAEATMIKNNIPYLKIDYSDYSDCPDLTAKRISDYFGLEVLVPDLGFNKKYNTSGYRGAIMRWADFLADVMPDGFRKFLKKLIPARLLKIIFPMRYEK